MPNTDVGAKMLSVKGHTDKLAQLAGAVKMASDAAAGLSQQRDRLAQIHDSLTAKGLSMNIHYSAGVGIGQFAIEMDTTDGIDRGIMGQVTALMIELVNERLKRRLRQVNDLSKEITKATGD